MSDDRSKRVQRVERELLETLSHFLVHGLGEPLPAMVSISAVESNVDLRHARVFFRIIGEPGPARATQEILEEARPRFQRDIASNIKMKFCPVLKFEFGQPQKATEIDELLENLKRPRFGFSGDADD